MDRPSSFRMPSLRLAPYISLRSNSDRPLYLATSPALASHSLISNFQIWIKTFEALSIAFKLNPVEQLDALFLLLDESFLVSILQAHWQRKTLPDPPNTNFSWWKEQLNKCLIPALTPVTMEQDVKEELSHMESVVAALPLDSSPSSLDVPVVDTELPLSPQQVDLPQSIPSVNVDLSLSVDTELPESFVADSETLVSSELRLSDSFMDSLVDTPLNSPQTGSSLVEDSGNLVLVVAPVLKPNINATPACGVQPSTFGNSFGTPVADFGTVHCILCGHSLTFLLGLVFWLKLLENLVFHNTLTTIRHDVFILFYFDHG
jgi:hypothetical protein